MSRHRRFFLAYPDRILFGTDRATSGSEAGFAPAALREELKDAERQYAGWWQYTSRTLRLPAPVLTQFFSGNARRLLHLSNRSLFGGLDRQPKG